MMLFLDNLGQPVASRPFAGKDGARVSSVCAGSSRVAVKNWESDVRGHSAVFGELEITTSTMKVILFPGSRDQYESVMPAQITMSLRFCCSLPIKTKILFPYQANNAPGFRQRGVLRPLRFVSKAVL